MTATASTTPFKHTLTLDGEREIRVEREFDAPLANVWRAYSDPAIVAQWWGRGNKVVVERFEFERGGHWRFVEHENGKTHGFEGRIREIVPMQRISQTFEWDGMPGHVIVETTTFEETADGRTRIVGHSMFMTAEDRDGMVGSGMEGGMAESFAALDRVLTTL